MKETPACDLPVSLRWSDFYRLSWTLQLARQALNAVIFTHRVRFLLRKRMTRRLAPVIERYGTHIDAYAVADTNVPVYCDVCSMNSLPGGKLDWSPDFVSLVLRNNLSILLKISVDRQKISPAIFGRKRRY